SRGAPPALRRGGRPASSGRARRRGDRRSSWGAPRSRSGREATADGRAPPRWFEARGPRYRRAQRPPWSPHVQPVVPRLRTELTRVARRLPAWTRTGPPLVVAAARGDTQRVAALLDAGTPIDAANERGQSALHAAARCSRAETAAMPLVRGARHDLRDARG